MPKTEEISCKDKDYYVTIYDSNGDIVYELGFDARNLHCVYTIDFPEPEKLAYPLKMTFRRKKGLPNERYIEVEVDPDDNFGSSFCLPEFGSETQETEER